MSGLFTTHLLSLDSLLAVIDSIEQHCHHRVLNSAQLSKPENPESTFAKATSEGRNSFLLQFIVAQLLVETECAPVTSSCVLSCHVVWAKNTGFCPWAPPPSSGPVDVARWSHFCDAFSLFFILSQFSISNSGNRRIDVSCFAARNIGRFYASSFHIIYFELIGHSFELYICSLWQLSMV